MLCLETAVLSTSMLLQDSEGWRKLPLPPGEVMQMWGLWEGIRSWRAAPYAQNPMKEAEGTLGLLHPCEDTQKTLILEANNDRIGWGDVFAVCDYTEKTWTTL